MYKPSPLLSPILVPAGFLYEAGIRVRNACYGSGLIAAQRVGAPVISIGNITLGGSGKTPLAMHLALLLQKFGATAALLSRGYGRTSTERLQVIAPGESVESPALKLGDEPALARRHIPSLWLGISANRLAAAREILRRCSNPVFLLDDGFQHRRLHRDLDMVILDATQPLLHAPVFPRGNLREPATGLRRAHLILINCAPNAGERSEALETIVQCLAPAARVFRCRQPVEALVPYRDWLSGHPCTETRSPVSVFLVAAVGNPARFEAALRNRKVEIAGRRTYRDHYRITALDWQSCAREAESLKADAIVTTEKDAIKIQKAPEFPLLIAVQKTALEREDEFERILGQVVGTAHA
jgi:tetraacyldisaccharide 4'-kinase